MLKLERRDDFNKDYVWADANPRSPFFGTGFPLPAVTAARFILISGAACSDEVTAAPLFNPLSRPIAAAGLAHEFHSDRPLQ